MSSNVVLTVSQISESIRKVLTRSYKDIWVSGEVTGLTIQRSKHLYFSLKDKDASIRAVVWGGKSVDFNINELKNGDHIQVLGSITTYSAQSNYQINVDKIKKVGLGSLFEAYIQLKEKLKKEGLFNEEHKKPLPLFPRTIGVVTSLNAAALRDVMTTFARRAPHVHVILYPTAVQGKGAENDIAHAIQTADQRKEVDLLIVCRGGGSLEDLWCFNEEVVSRAVFNCSIPIISGVGHETDTTLIDLASDVRAPTPTGAAEMASRETHKWLEELESLAQELQETIHTQLHDLSQTLDLISPRLLSPKAYIEKCQDQIKIYAKEISHFKEQTLTSIKHQLNQLRDKLIFLHPKTAPLQAELTLCSQTLFQSMKRLLERHQQNKQSLETQLALLNPQEILNRGYAIIRTTRGTVVRSPNQLSLNTPMSIKLAKGSARITLTSIQEELD